MVGVPMAEGFAEAHTKLVNCCLRDGSKTGSLPVFNTTYVSWGIELSDDLIYHREKTASLPHPSAKTGSLAVSSLWRWLRSPNPSRNCFHHGQYLACRTEWIASTHRLPTRSWSLSGNVFSVADHWGTRDGWNRSCVDSVWNPPCVRVAVRESNLCPKNKTKRPDPFVG